MRTPSHSPWSQRPETNLGRWAVGLMLVFLGMFLINSLVFMPLFGYRTETTWFQHNILPFYGVFMMLSGFASGVLGLLALVRAHDRSWMVQVTLFPLAFTILFMLGEILFPH